jgi:hypothetical protein
MHTYQTSRTSFSLRASSLVSIYYEFLHGYCKDQRDDCHKSTIYPCLHSCALYFADATIKLIIGTECFNFIIVCLFVCLFVLFIVT